MTRLRAGAAVVAAGLALAGCGPSPDFTSKRSQAREFLQAVRASAPTGYTAGAIEGGQWPNEGRGPNMWINLRLLRDSVDVGRECERVRQWVVTLGATTFQDGNDGANPVLPIAGNERQAQAVCVRWWVTALTSEAPAGSPAVIYGGARSRGDGDAIPFHIEANASADVPPTGQGLRRSVNLFVVTDFN